MSSASRNPDLHAIFRPREDCEMRASRCEAEEIAGETFELDWVFGSDDGKELAVLSM